MTFGDQAALLGVLNLVRPNVAVEVGTYQGGSLEIIAAAAGSVHTVDLVPHVDKRLPNVEYHYGESRTALPTILATLLERREFVGFVLIDGDHERSAVAADLRAVLDSPAVAHAVVLLHDAANEDVRLGIKDANLQRPHVAYADLSFTVPGDRLWPWNEAWGGFAMVVVDRSGSFWPHARGIATNASRRTSAPQSMGWHALAPARTLRRRTLYRLRPLYRRFRGTRGAVYETD